MVEALNAVHPDDLARGEISLAISAADAIAGPTQRCRAVARSMRDSFSGLRTA